MLCIAWCFIIRLGLALGTDTYSDEAYYWTWSQHLQLSYFDHPALIAWSIKFFGIRSGAMLWAVIALWGVYRLAMAYGGSRQAAWWATAFFASTPAAGLLGTICTPDAPLLAFWAWTLVALARKQPVATGLLWGLAMLSKYNGILLALPVFVVFFRQPFQLMKATLLALLVTCPTLIWNATNDWEGFRFQLWHGLEGDGGLNTFLEFLGGQLGMAGPLLLVLIIGWLIRDKSWGVLKLAALIPLLFFGYASLKARGEANWTAAAWISASVGLSLTPLNKWKQAALGLNLVLVSATALVLLFPPQALWSSQAMQKLHGWSWLKQAQTQQVPVFTGRYQLSAMVQFYSGLPVTTFGGRKSQFNLWPAPYIAPGTDALWIGEGDEPPEELLNRFETSTRLDWPLDERQRLLHPFQVFRMKRLKASP